jgi:maltose alpha-D-glucosyltransferase/alpha-amylase
LAPLETPLASLSDAVASATSGDDPLWYKDAVIYQAHVKSFFDSSGDGVGDFPGLTQKLDYLQGLGITCLWLLPFFPSPLKDDGYDIADYLNVHPAYGTLDDFKAFVRAAHERQIKVLIELVVNHTSDQHPWFQRARHAPPDSPERAFYVWSDTDQKFPETRIIFCDTEKSNWAYDPVARQYYWHRFFSHQPDLNHNNPAVVEAVIDVMKFWLDLGVDALRLDAVPYLCVREGTNNENLRETHDVLKRMRRSLDAAYQNRMLLAEANQWPADVRPYFGDGDECHMAFHFPLMPRMFMAMRQEDRHAITEILSQTPEIPENCQWALFLRNHDELTLEMVTDEERDYMYQAYAADPQMRLNLGIRRRLAPLLENSRRRIELLNTLLFSLPGTPIIYYGDEIGMGDNIYLGDRNGVRTPMQWSSDRNGGFSRADPARLFAPPIMDPVYGFQAINVEAQERYPFSLLNWMKRLIALRKQHRVFGRGSIELVGCSNRKVLAFTRRDEHETILVVANLSRTVQPAEIDLAAFQGLYPVEMVGQTEFPRVGDRPYFLTLGPHAAYWFALRQEPMHLTQTGGRMADPNTALTDSLPALLVGVDWEGVLDSGTRTVLERQALAPFLQRQRWFGAKSREIRQVRFADWTMVRTGASPAFLAIAAVAFADGTADTYLLPLAFASGDEARRILHDMPGAVLARITGARKGVLMDGFYDDDVCERIVTTVGEQRELTATRGALRGGLVEGPFDMPAERRWARASDHSNSVAIFGGRYVLKLYRRLEAGPNPEVEIGRLLTSRGFERVPRTFGSLQYTAGDAESTSVALVQQAVGNQGTGWDFSIDELRRYYERVAARTADGTSDTAAHAATADGQPPPFFLALEGWYLTGAATLGRRTAELHVTLADSEDPAFQPEPLSGPELGLLADSMRRHAADVLDRLASKLPSLPEGVRAQAEAVLASRSVLLERLGRAASLADGGARIRIHGDYHLGQVLRTEEDFVIIDFEGEPARPAAERRAKHSPLKDVAGMLRSFGYAAHAALLASASDQAAASSLESWADAWQHWVGDAFLRAYRAAAAAAPRPLVPPGPACNDLLKVFVLDKALYELGYELDNRPDWVRIPLKGILGSL